MNPSQVEHLGQSVQAVRPLQMGALPLIYPILSGLDVRQTTNRLVASEADIDLGRVVELLVLNRLCLHSPCITLELLHSKICGGYHSKKDALLVQSPCFLPDLAAMWDVIPMNFNRNLILQQLYSGLASRDGIAGSVEDPSRTSI